jgi:hypothetical protein
MTPGPPDWLAPLTAEIAAAGNRPDDLALVFERLRSGLGADEAGRRWWAAFGATDASAT